MRNNLTFVSLMSVCVSIGLPACSKATDQAQSTAVSEVTTASIDASAAAMPVEVREEIFGQIGAMTVASYYQILQSSVVHEAYSFDGQEVANPMQNLLADAPIYAMLGKNFSSMSKLWSFLHLNLLSSKQVGLSLYTQYTALPRGTNSECDALIDSVAGLRTIRLSRYPNFLLMVLQSSVVAPSNLIRVMAVI